MSDMDRAAALAALTGGEATAAAVEPVTGTTYYAGGDVERRLVGDISITYVVDGAGLQRVNAGAGDLVQLSAEEAKRLDSLGVTAPAATDPADLVDPTLVDPSDPAGFGDALGPANPDLFAQLNAADLVELAKAQPELAGEIHAYELARPEKDRRKTVLEATAPTE